MKNLLPTLVALIAAPFAAAQTTPCPATYDPPTPNACPGGETHNPACLSPAEAAHEAAWNLTVRPLYEVACLHTEDATYHDAEVERIALFLRLLHRELAYWERECANGNWGACTYAALTRLDIDHWFDILDEKQADANGAWSTASQAWSAAVTAAAPIDAKYLAATAACCN